MPAFSLGLHTGVSDWSLSTWLALKRFQMIN